LAKISTKGKKKIITKLGNNFLIYRVSYSLPNPTFF
jgi:hypothetical protein